MSTELNKMLCQYCGQCFLHISIHLNKKGSFRISLTGSNRRLEKNIHECTCGLVFYKDIPEILDPVEIDGDVTNLIYYV